jgi:hypothetical protein
MFGLGETRARKYQAQGGSNAQHERVHASLNVVVVFLPQYQKPIVHQAENRFLMGGWQNNLIRYAMPRVSSLAVKGWRFAAAVLTAACRA